MQRADGQSATQLCLNSMATLPRVVTANPGRCRTPLTARSNTEKVGSGGGHVADYLGRRAAGTTLMPGTAPRVPAHSLAPDRDAERGGASLTVRAGKIMAQETLDIDPRG